MLRNIELRTANERLPLLLDCKKEKACSHLERDTNYTLLPCTVCSDQKANDFFFNILGRHSSSTYIKEIHLTNGFAFI